MPLRMEKFEDETPTPTPSSPKQSEQVGKKVENEGPHVVIPEKAEDLDEIDLGKPAEKSEVESPEERPTIESIDKKITNLRVSSTELLKNAKTPAERAAIIERFQEEDARLKKERRELQEVEKEEKRLTIQAKEDEIKALRQSSNERLSHAKTQEEREAIAQEYDEKRKKLQAELRELLK